MQGARKSTSFQLFCILLLSSSMRCDTQRNRGKDSKKNVSVYIGGSNSGRICIECENELDFSALRENLLNDNAPSNGKYLPANYRNEKSQFESPLGLDCTEDNNEYVDLQRSNPVFQFGAYGDMPDLREFPVYLPPWLNYQLLTVPRQIQREFQFPDNQDIPTVAQLEAKLRNLYSPGVTVPEVFGNSNSALPQPKPVPRNEVTLNFGSTPKYDDLRSPYPSVTSLLFKLPKKNLSNSDAPPNLNDNASPKPNDDPLSLSAISNSVDPNLYDMPSRFLNVASVSSNEPNTDYSDSAAPQNLNDMTGPTENDAPLLLNDHSDSDSDSAPPSNLNDMPGPTQNDAPLSLHDLSDTAPPSNLNDTTGPTQNDAPLSLNDQSDSSTPPSLIDTTGPTQNDAPLLLNDHSDSSTPLNLNDTTGPTQNDAPLSLNDQSDSSTPPSLNDTTGPTQNDAPLSLNDHSGSGVPLSLNDSPGPSQLEEQPEEFTTAQSNIQFDIGPFGNPHGSMSLHDGVQLKLAEPNIKVRPQEPIFEGLLPNKDHVPRSKKMDMKSELRTSVTYAYQHDDEDCDDCRK